MSTDTIDPAKYPLTLQAKPFPLGKRSAYEGELFAIYEANGLTIREVSANEQPYEYDECSSQWSTWRACSNLQPPATPKSPHGAPPRTARGLRGKNGLPVFQARFDHPRLAREPRQARREPVNRPPGAWYTVGPQAGAV